LIANGAGVAEIAASIGADSLQYISEEGMITATQQPRERLCTACFTGDYPIPLPGEDERGKHLLEKPAAEPAPTVDPAERPGAVGEDPGPGASLEPLLTETDRTPL
jgi:amidophosphoribosyltransferase